MASRTALKAAPRSRPTTRKTGMNLPEDLLYRLRVAAAEEQTSMTRIVIRLCEDWLARRPKRG